MPFFTIASRFARRLGDRKTAALISFAGLMVLLGAAAFSLTQHISYGVALYWAVTTATTVGYGDVTPHNTAGRVVASVVMLTTIPSLAAVFALWTGRNIIHNVRRLLGMDSTLPPVPYTLVYGTSPVLALAMNELAATGDPIVLVAPSRPAGMDGSVSLLAGDPTDEALIRASEPARANRALIATTADADTLVIAVAVHTLAPQLETFALVHSSRVARALRELGVSHTLSAEELIGHTLAKSLETPQAGDLLLKLVDSSTYRLSERAVSDSETGQPLSAARGQADTLVLGLSKGDQVDLCLGDDPTLTAGDKLIVLAPAR